MRFQLLWLCVVATALLSAAEGESGPKWQSVAETDHGFAVLMPGKPLCISGGGSHTFVVSVYDPPNLPPGSGNKETIFRVMVDRYTEYTGADEKKCAKLMAWHRDVQAKSHKGKVTQEKAIKYGNHRGIEFLVEAERRIVRYRLLIVQHRREEDDPWSEGLLYALSVESVAGVKQDVVSKDADNFFNSFKVVSP